MAGTNQQPLLGNYEFQVTWSMADMFGYSLLWLLLILITFGLASFFAPYAWAAKLLNGCEVRDRSGTGWERFRSTSGLPINWSTFCCGWCLGTYIE